MNCSKPVLPPPIYWPDDQPKSSPLIGQCNGRCLLHRDTNNSYYVLASGGVCFLLAFYFLFQQCSSCAVYKLRREIYTREFVEPLDKKYTELVLGIDERKQKEMREEEEKKHELLEE